MPTTRVDDRNELAPACYEVGEAGRRSEHDQMVACAPQAAAGGEALSWR
jgi:hypothetical protein